MNEGEITIESKLDRKLINAPNAVKKQFKTIGKELDEANRITNNGKIRTIKELLEEEKLKFKT